jgi:ABC-type phosphate transport system substrate-binding protein
MCFTSLGGLSTVQLATMYGTPGTTFADIAGGATTACPTTPILLSGADDQSGTYSYFFKDVLSKVASPPAGIATPLASITGYAARYTNSHLDETIVAYVNANPTAIGFFGYSYYAANAGTLTAVAIKNSANAYVAPTMASIADGSYNPLARPIYMNVVNTKWKMVTPYLKFAISAAGQDMIAEAGFVALPASLAAVEASKFGGTSATTYTCPSAALLLEGSSTVKPIAEGWRKAFAMHCDQGITVRGGGSSNGARAVCGEARETSNGAKLKISSLARLESKMIGD